MKNERICIYNDEMYENEVHTGIKYAGRLLQELINSFNAMKFGEVQPNELEKVINNPEALFQERINLNIEVPAGLKRDAYLNMVELPDFTPVNEAWQRFRATGFLDQELYSLENGKIGVNKAEVQRLAESNNLYVAKNSPEHVLSNELQEFIRLINQFDDMTSNGFLDRLYSAGCPIYDILDIQEKPGSYTRMMARFNPHKFRELARKKLVTA